jgi:hypothetical protein
MCAPHLDQPRNAGDVEPFPSGRITYLAPLPLPTLLPPHGPHIGELNEVYMDFGLGSPQVFMWQMTLGLPFSGAFSIAFLIPLFGGFMFFLFGMGWDDISHAIEGVFNEAYGIALVTGFVTLLIGLGVWRHNHNKRAAIIPTRFNRQRREICFMPEAGIEPCSLSLKIKENFKFENFSTSMCTLIGLFQWYDWNAVGHRVDENIPGVFAFLVKPP